MLIITYFKLENIKDPFKVSICSKHWKQWYDYNYKLKKCFENYIEPSFEQPLFKSLVDAVGQEPCAVESNCSMSFFSEPNIHLLKNIFNFLDINAFKALSETCRFLYQQIKMYLKQDSVWQRL